MKLYNSLSNKIEIFHPHNPNEIKMYTCGPTVYHYAHIGNLRTYISEDILEKTLIFLGYNVKRVMNITDVGHLTSDADLGDDKMVKGAIRENKSVLEIANYYTEAFRNDCKNLNIKWPKIVIPATTEIDEYISMIKKLLNNGYAYHSGNNIYFDTSKVNNYYSLSNNKKNTLKEAVRDTVSIDINKKNNNDFVLWFTKSKFENQELKWDSPWGYGYPGWHIECSAISLKYLGEYLDIHCGGVDNIFPHHTNEIAQTEGCIGHKWCNYWFHGEHLNNKEGKMSKSKGEFITLKTLEEKNINPLHYRFFCLLSHYRKPLEFSYESLNIASKSYEKLKNKICLLNKEIGSLNKTIINEYLGKFQTYLEDDLNTASCITLLYDIIKDDNINDYTKIFIINKIDTVLSLNLLNEDNNNNIINDEFQKEIDKLIKKRQQAKDIKDFKTADKIRLELEKKGIILTDTRAGTNYTVRRNYDI